MHDSCRGRHERYSNSNTPIVFLLEARVGLSSTLDVSQHLFMTSGSTIIDGQIISFVNILKNREGKKEHTKIDKEEKEMKRIRKNWMEGVWLLNLNFGEEIFMPHRP